ncbi:hypothetical protein BO86DRAFT_421977 [Aspergillus japonicus CBS 114.51]|uniref:Uncharacterized protein n=2 Tax=Aspergillus TaxID=5052 RepID=A0A2V5GXG0_ASPV1|nr:hypothetical protein BO86DRAFT_421977 [Aspergillus japonicus CBS 114.51]PYI13824.1 hypothetical protein BO99DRAFT_447354 [Aspergillus violaceofuscus CBS 115571]RAH77923.1 hypothetical protein BO86DRAFT_421977 [Aspergillus japonicus CBS 114.51]
MKQAIEQAGSMFTGWISSCSFCVHAGNDDESYHHHQEAMQRRGAEREMKICHTQQPRLIPPMKPFVYDEAPTPPRPRPRTPSFPSWMLESKSRASISLKRKSTAAPPIRISAPSDFRRVSTFRPDAEVAVADGLFSPLELSFETPGRQLPALPHFEDFSLETDRRSPVSIIRPPRAVALAGERSRPPQPTPRAQHRPSSSFQLPRKPVGSGSRRSSLAAHEYLGVGETQAAATTTTSNNSRSSPFIPHFSSRSSSAIAIVPSTNTDNQAPPRQSINAAAAATRTTTFKAPRTPPHPTNLQDRPLPCIPTPEEDGETSASSRSTASSTHPPRTPTDDRERTPSRSGRVTQWLFHATSSSNSNSSSPTTKNQSPAPSPPAWLKQENPPQKGGSSPFRIRSRTLSGSTLASSITNLTGGVGGGFKGSSVSSSTATCPAPPPAAAKGIPNKELGSPFIPRVAEDRSVYPTIFESEYHHHPQQQRHSHPSHHQDQEEYEDLRQSQYYENYRHSAVGLAF